MWCQLLVVSLLIAGTHAFNSMPIRWGALSSRSFVLAPSGLPNKVSVSERTKLVLSEQSGRVSSNNEIPHFSMNPDNTIVLDGAGLCIEASGDKSGDAIQINACSGESTQQWNVLPWGRLTNQIQLKGTTKCIDVEDKETGLNGATVLLHDCENQRTEAWQFEEPLPLPDAGTSHVDALSSSLRYVMMPFLAIAALGAFGVATTMTKARAVVDPQGATLLAAEQGGVALTSALPSQTLSANATEVSPAAMTRSSMSSEELENLGENIRAKMADASFLEESERIAEQMTALMANLDFQEQVKKVAAQMKAGNYTSASSEQTVDDDSLNAHAAEKAPQSLEEHMNTVFSSSAFFEETMRIARELQETVASFDFQEEAKQAGEVVTAAFAHSTPMMSRRKTRLCTPMMSAAPEEQDAEGSDLDVSDLDEPFVPIDDFASANSFVERFDPNKVAASLATLAALHPDAVWAKGGEFGIFEGRIVSLAHPAVMALMYGASAFAGFTGWQWRRLRELGTEANELTSERKKVEAKIAAYGEDEQDKVPSALKNELQTLTARIDEIKETRKDLAKKNLRDKHHQVGSVVLGLGTAFAIEGPVNTFLRAQKLFPGPHLYAGAGVVVCWAMAASLVPMMSKGENWARNAHIAFNILAIGLFTWQLPTGWEILLKVIKFTTFP